MSDIKRIAGVGLLLLGLAGPATYFGTKWIDGSVSSGELFAVGWINAAIGIIAATIAIGYLRESEDYGKVGMRHELFGTMAGGIAITAFVQFLLGGIVYFFVSGSLDIRGGDWHWDVFLTFTLSCVFGEAIAFLVHWATFVDDDWFGERAESEDEDGTGTVTQLRDAR